MKLSGAALLSAVLLLGVTFVAAQDRGDYRWDNRNGYYNGQNGQYNGGYRSNADYQRGVQDGINSGRADANQGKAANLQSHPYYTNSNNPAYREGFMQGYREAYGQTRGANGYYNRDNGYYNGNNGYYNNSNRRDHDRDHDQDRDHARDHDRDENH